MITSCSTQEIRDKLHLLARARDLIMVRLWRDSFERSKWRKIHAAHYHPSVEGIVQRIREAKEKNQWLFDEWSTMLEIELDVRDKIVVEIGCGGGWYLAQMLYRRAKEVFGFEIDQSILQKARAAFERLNFGVNLYEFLEVDKRYLNALSESSVDIVFEITVFQHIPRRMTRNYVRTARSVLRENGIMLCQFLMNDEKPTERLPFGEEGTVYYSHKQVSLLVEECGMRIYKWADYRWTDGIGSYWRIYVLVRAG